MKIITKIKQNKFILIGFVLLVCILALVLVWNEKFHKKNNNSLETNTENKCLNQAQDINLMYDVRISLLQACIKDPLKAYENLKKEFNNTHFNSSRLGGKKLVNANINTALPTYLDFNEIDSQYAFEKAPYAWKFNKRYSESSTKTIFTENNILDIPNHFFNQVSDLSLLSQVTLNGEKQDPFKSILKLLYYQNEVLTHQRIVSIEQRSDDNYYVTVYQYLENKSFNHILGYILKNEGSTWKIIEIVEIQVN